LLFCLTEEILPYQNYNTLNVANVTDFYINKLPYNH